MPRFRAVRRARVSGALCAALAAWLVAACATWYVTTDYDVAADFSGYRTFAWMERTYTAERLQKRRAAIESLLDKKVHQAVTEALAARGFTEVDRREADLLVTFHTDTTHRVNITSLPYGYPPLWQPPYRQVEVFVYKEQTLIIDVIDPALFQLVWRGTASGVVDQADLPQSRVNDAVKAILKRFPPHPPRPL